MTTTSRPPLPSSRDLVAILAPYRKSQTLRPLAQVSTTLLLFGLLLGLAYFAVPRWPLLVGLLVPVIGMTWLRVFILQHDCGHGSLFASARVNRWLGRALGPLVLTPFDDWSYNHRLHHSTSGQLHQRGWDRDIYTMTVEEYRSASPTVRLVYRLLRSRLVLVCVVAPWVFIIRHRFPGSAGAPLRARRSVLFTNLALVVLAGCSWFLGPLRVLTVVGPAFAVASGVGVWLFHVQHQFERAYWDDEQSWRFVDAALTGSSRLVLPWPFRWFSADIGLHHIHHLSPRIPNYQLRACDEALPWLRRGTSFTLWQALRAPAAHLWEEQQGRLVPIREAGD